MWLQYSRNSCVWWKYWQILSCKHWRNHLASLWPSFPWMAIHIYSYHSNLLSSRMSVGLLDTQLWRLEIPSQAAVSGEGVGLRASGKQNGKRAWAEDKRRLSFYDSLFLWEWWKPFMKAESSQCKCWLEFPVPLKTVKLGERPRWVVVRTCLLKLYDTVHTPKQVSLSLYLSHELICERSGILHFVSLSHSWHWKRVIALRLLFWSLSACKLQNKFLKEMDAYGSLPSSFSFVWVALKWFHI